MEQNYNFYKVGGILLKDRKLLVTRSKGKEFFIAPGGKVEEGEVAFDALKRELREELDIEIEEAHIQKFGTFYAPAAGNEQSILRMDVFIINEWYGDPKPSSEIEELAWILSQKDQNTEGMKIGSIFEHQVIPKLKEMDLID